MVLNIDGDEVEIPPPSEEELLLTRLVFGDTTSFHDNLKKVDNLFEESDIELDDPSSSDESDGFFIDENADESKIDMDIDSDGSYNDDAWNDSDDERIAVTLNTSRLKKLQQAENETVSGKNYILRLRSQFEKIYARPEWVDQMEDESVFGSEDEEEVSEVRDNDTTALLDILGRTSSIVAKDMRLLAPNRIGIVRLKDANYQKLSKSGIQSLQFHHSHPLLLTGGFDKTLRVYHIDGTKNALVSSLHLKNTPIMSCAFAPGGQNLVFAAGRRRYMNKWDLDSGAVEKISRLYGHEQHQRSFETFKMSPGGKYIGLSGSGGWINLLNGTTGQWVRGFKIEGMVSDFVFTKNDETVIVINRHGDIWEFGTDSGRVERWKDDGGVGITKIAIGGNDRWMAVGSNNGVVNLYDRSSKKPFRAVENLVSSISTLEFSPDGQILVVASRSKRDALRLVHLPTGSVFGNWPTSGTPLGRVSAVGFSGGGEMMGVGNEGGKVTLWRLTHY